MSAWPMPFGPGWETALIAIIGFLYFQEPVTWLRATCVLLIVMGVFGLNLTGSH